MSHISNVSSFAPTTPVSHVPGTLSNSIIAPPKTHETPADRMKKKEEVRREVEYQIAKSKPKEERTDRDKLVIISHTIQEILSAPTVLNTQSNHGVSYLA